MIDQNLSTFIAFVPLIIVLLAIVGNIIWILISKIKPRVKKYRKKRNLMRHLTREKIETKMENNSSKGLKYDGFSDEETRAYAKSIGARNIRQLNLIQEYKAPNYEIAKKIHSGNFGSYKEFLEAEEIGANTQTELLFIKKYKAPDLETALQAEKNGFNSFNEMQNALEKGANTKSELELIEKLNSQTLDEAKEILKAGFEDRKTYRLALSKGITNANRWKTYLQELKEQLLTYKKLKKDLNKDYIMNKLQITDMNELLQVLGKLYIPVMGTKILFSYDNASQKHSESSYTEFDLFELLGSNQEIEICKICLEPISGSVGTCIKCNQKYHYDCVSTWVTQKNSCPICLEHLQQTDIIFSEQKESLTEDVHCTLCDRPINPLLRVIRCDYCFSIYHIAEFLEYIKVKGKCQKCNQTLKF